MLKQAVSRSTQAMGDSNMSVATRDKLRTQFYDKLKDRLHALKVLHNKPDAAVRATDDEAEGYLSNRIRRGAHRSIEQNGGKVIRDSSGIAGTLGPVTLGRNVHMPNTPEEVYDLFNITSGGADRALTPNRKKLLDSWTLNHEALEQSHLMRRSKGVPGSSAMLDVLEKTTQPTATVSEESVNAAVRKFQTFVHRTPFGHLSHEIVPGKGKRLHGGEVSTVQKLPADVREMIGKTRVASMESLPFTIHGGKYPNAPRGMGGLVRRTNKELPELLARYKGDLSGDMQKAVSGGDFSVMLDHINTVKKSARDRVVAAAKKNLALTGKSTLPPQNNARYLSRLVMEYIPKVR